ncbi:hypothetical protein [Mycoplasmopsis cynos]|uniref:hypothetical protein n=1 Tax=Mycoplasmopsis cynos TaxID=171284 RepID=UPI0022025C2A|nr:hypothetical protein [Mycoplasmopsis cynos]UWV92551.1 hypothetical protein NWE57_00195 [Mycoplasmopsis cynos]
MGFRDYYNTRNNKLISKHNVFNQEGKKNGNWVIDIVVNRKVLNVVVRYNSENYAAFNLENERVIFPFNSIVSLVHSSRRWNIFQI